MTVRDLLTHTSGLSYGIIERTHLDAAYRKLGIGEGKGTLSDMVEKLGQLPLEFSPGTRWGYSVATDVIARLVEILSGRRFDEYLREQIFEPARHGRHGVHGRRRQAAAIRGELRALARRRDEALRRPRGQRVRAPEDALHGEHGAHLHGGRLRALRRDAPARRMRSTASGSSGRERSGT